MWGGEKYKKRISLGQITVRTNLNMRKNLTVRTKSPCGGGGMRNIVTVRISLVQ